MKIYINNDTNNLTVVQSVASASTMISSVAVEAKDYILSKFPKNYFKHVYIDTSQTVSQQHINDRYNKNANKIPYPSMGITPEISLDDPIGGMQKGLHLSSPNLYLRKDLDRAYKKLLMDPDEKISIYYTSDYITTNFNFKLVTNSYIQNADLAYFLQSNFQRDFFQFVNSRYVQSEIPKTFIRTIADIKGWNLNKDTEMDELRLYLIGNSKQEETIQKRINLATGKQCFFLNDKQNFLVLFTDLDCPPSINRDSQTEGEYTITFRLQISTWIPNSYIMTIDKSVYNCLCDKTKDELKEPTDDQQEQGILASHSHTIYMIKNKHIYFRDSSGNEQLGQLVYHDVYTYSLNTPIPVIDIKKLLPKEFVYLYEKIQNGALYLQNIDLSSLYKVIIYTTNNGEIPSSDYNFDYNKLGAGITFNTAYSEDIGIAVYVNRLLYETLIKAIKSNKNYFNNNYLASVLIHPDNLYRVIVKSFVDKEEEYSTDINKSLRIFTSVGSDGLDKKKGTIGYISLIDENKKHYKDDCCYRVCVGYNDNEPIIRQFEIDE